MNDVINTIITAHFHFGFNVYHSFFCGYVFLVDFVFMNLSLNRLVQKGWNGKSCLEVKFSPLYITIKQSMNHLSCDKSTYSRWVLQLREYDNDTMAKDITVSLTTLLWNTLLYVCLKFSDEVIKPFTDIPDQVGSKSASNFCWLYKLFVKMIVLWGAQSWLLVWVRVGRGVSLQPWSRFENQVQRYCITSSYSLFLCP